jgi:hypothetical protein
MLPVFVILRRFVRAMALDVLPILYREFTLVQHPGTGEGVVWEVDPGVLRSFSQSFRSP